MKEMIKMFMNRGLSRAAAEMTANDIATCLDIMERNGSLKEEAVIGFYEAAKERGLDSIYVKGVINMAKSLSKCK